MSRECGARRMYQANAEPKSTNGPTMSAAPFHNSRLLTGALTAIGNLATNTGA